MIKSIKNIQWKLSSMADLSWTCPKCGQTVHDDNVCGVCGHKFSSK